MAQARAIRILATAFGAFPGVRVNPSLALARALARAAPPAQTEIEFLVLPVIWLDAAARLEAAIRTSRPDVVLSIGVAARRLRPGVETRALDRRSILRRDAERRQAPSRLIAGEAAARRARVPAARLAATMTRAGARTACSNDPGDYICNETMHAALGTPVPLVGFVHVPRLRDPRAPAWRAALAPVPRPTAAQTTAALRAALAVLAVEARNARLAGLRRTQREARG
jgi:pyroglutamyl-peptidase